MSFKLLPVLVAIALFAAVQGYDDWDEITDRVKACMRLVPYKQFGGMRVSPKYSCVDSVGTQLLMGMDKSEVTAYVMNCLANWRYGVTVPPAYTQSELSSGRSCLEKEMAKPL